jgi:hypothetical protein
LLDLNLPIPEAPLPASHKLCADAVYAMNESFAKRFALDDAYWARSLAGKNPEPFVM